MGESIMATSISDFDLFSMVESLISEEQVSKEEVPTEEFEEEAVKLKIKASNNKKKKASRKEKSKKEEAEPDVIDKDEDKEEVETPDESPSTLRLADALEYKKFIDDLNKFRAAHSFDDEEISKELKSFFQKLEDDEKKVFYIILKGLIQVSLMGVDGKTARTPSELKFSIKKTGSVTSEKKRSMKRKIDIQKDLDDDKKVDTSTPIKIGESRQNKNDVYKVIRENK
tara:strand:+ start:10109 stop:10789 length:681 start_codon:yes stop_codon:yes gene_type:complete